MSRPQSYHYAKNKIIVHHTAWDTSNFTGPSSAVAYMQEIYAYHTKKWGDIGYNFVIDPYGNIYEGRAGGDSVIGAHATWNNTPSVWISLMGNFEVQKPTDAAIKSLTALVTALAKKYNIDPLAKTDYHIATTTEPYIKSVTNYRLAGHRDAGTTACPGKNLYAQLSVLRNTVRANLQNGILVKSTSTSSVSPNTQTNTTTKAPEQQANLWTVVGDLSLLKKRVPNFDVYVAKIKDSYSTANKIVPSAAKTTKIFNQISLKESQKLMAWDIKVLLYELSSQYNQRSVSCDNQCIFTAGNKTLMASSWSIVKQKTMFDIWISDKKLSVTKINVRDSKGGLVHIDNYSRLSYAKIPWNTFSGSLTFGQESVKNLSTGKYAKQTAIVNTLSFMHYLRGIAETNDSEYPEKIKVMQLISKGYALFYINGKNKHPAIPQWATYNAIDDPNSFQKYVGAGLEKTLTKVYTQFETTKNQIITYKWNLPILPYFSCSAGFTWSGKEKRGRTDTPYLVSRIDPVSCTKFDWHGVWLSGKWAQYLAMQWRTAEEILKYYYPGITINTIK